MFIVYSFVVLPLNLTLLLFHFGYFLILLELFSLCWGRDPKLVPSRIFLLLFGFPGSLIGFFQVVVECEVSLMGVWFGPGQVVLLFRESTEPPRRSPAGGSCHLGWALPPHCGFVPLCFSIFSS